MAMKLKPKPKKKQELVYEQSIKDFKGYGKQNGHSKTKTKR